MTVEPSGSLRGLVPQESKGSVVVSTSLSPAPPALLHGGSNLRRARTVAQGTHGSSSLANTDRDRVAANLLRMKDSHEVLRQRSLKRSNTHGALRDGSAIAKEAQHFMVGNVGNNGRIYLRYVKIGVSCGCMPCTSYSPTLKESFC